MDGCHSNLKTSAPIIIGTIPLMTYQTAVGFEPIPSEMGVVPSIGDVGWSVPSGEAYPTPPYGGQADMNVPYPMPSAPVSEPNMPIHGPSAPFYPDIRKFVYYNYSFFKFI